MDDIVNKIGSGELLREELKKHETSTPELPDEERILDSGLDPANYGTEIFKEGGNSSRSKDEQANGGYVFKPGYAKGFRPGRLPLDSELRPFKRDEKSVVHPVHWPDIVEKMKAEGEEDKIDSVRAVWDHLVMQGHELFKNDKYYRQNKWIWDRAAREVSPGYKTRRLPIMEKSLLMDQGMPIMQHSSQEDIRIDPVLPDPTLPRKQKFVMQKIPMIPKKRFTKINSDGYAKGKGRRKTAKAYAYVGGGTGKITINGRHWVDYFPSVMHREKIMEVFTIGQCIAMVDVRIKAIGGGVSAQCEAIQLALANGLVNFYPPLRAQFKRVKLLTYDTRQVERKKPGQAKARKKYQWSKR